MLSDAIFCTWTWRPSTAWSSPQTQHDALTRVSFTPEHVPGAGPATEIGGGLSFGAPLPRVARPLPSPSPPLSSALPGTTSRQSTFPSNHGCHSCQSFVGPRRPIEEQRTSVDAGLEMQLTPEALKSIAECKAHDWGVQRPSRENGSKPGAAL